MPWLSGPQNGHSGILPFLTQPLSPSCPARGFCSSGLRGNSEGNWALGQGVPDLIPCLTELGVLSDYITPLAPGRVAVG